MEAELKRLARRALPQWRDPGAVRIDQQTLAYPFDAELAWVAAHYARTPSRVLWDLFETGALRLEPLYDELLEYVGRDSRGWLFDGAAISVEVRRTDGFQAGPLQIRGTIKNAIVDAAQKRGLRLDVRAESPDVLISARGAPPIVAVDLGGGSLHRRGYRLAHGLAPLRETLAAQLLVLARWDPRTEALFDPFCGSGTIVIEAALMAKGAPLRVERHGKVEPRRDILPAFSILHDKVLLPLFPGEFPPMFGGDTNLDEIDFAKRNASRAGVDSEVRFFAARAGDWDAHGIRRALKQKPGSRWLDHGLIVTNPPYGERMGDPEELAAIADELFHLQRDLGWRLAVLTGDRTFLDRAPRRPTLRKPVSNGPIRAEFLVFDAEDRS